MQANAGDGLAGGVWLACGYAVFHAVFALLLYRRQRRASERSRAERPRRLFVRTLLTYSVWVAALVVCYRAGGFTAESVGVSTRVSPAVAFVAGFGECLLFRYVAAAVIAMLGSSERFWLAALRSTASSQPRAPALVVAVNPVTEEVMTRGLLVHQLGLWVPVGVVVALGAAVNAIHHAYQGRTVALFHLAFYAASVAILYSPLGLFGAIGFHFAGDLSAFVGYSQSLRGYREYRRTQRKAKARRSQT